MSNFIQPVAMQVTEEQIKNDLEKPLIKLGYHDFTEGNGYLVTADVSIPERLCIYGTINNFDAYRRHVIKTYNPKLFLAIAAMTKGEVPIVGEWMIMLRNYDYQLKGNLFEVKALKGFNNSSLGRVSENDPTGNGYFRKATLEELINHFSKETMTDKEKVEKRCFEAYDGDGGDLVHFIHEELTNTDFNSLDGYTSGDKAKLLIQKWESENKLTKTRFPFTLTKPDADKLISAACDGWKLSLAEKWGKDLLLRDYVEVSENYYNQIRKECNSTQHRVMDEVFGKDKKELTIDDFRDAVKNYLLNNGIADIEATRKYVSVHDDDKLSLNLDCSNNDFTKAIAKLLVIASEDKGFYAAFRSNESIKLKIMSGSTIKECINALKYE